MSDLGTSSSTLTAPSNGDLQPEQVKHTPGPWELVEATEHHGPYIVSAYGGDVADCYCMSNIMAASIRNGGTSFPINFCGDEAHANAHLIAAAPDMLAALSELTDIVQGLLDDTSLHGLGIDSFTLQPARTVIAKATGAA